MIPDNKINKEDIENILPLTSLQKGLLFHYLKEEGSEVYFEQLTLELSGNMNIDFFKEAWEIVARQNEVLRTVFRWNGLKEPIQIVLKSKKPNIVIHDLNGLTEEEITRKIAEFKEIDKKNGIYLEKEPWRVNLFLVNQERSIMIITNHHIIYDGWSNGIILKELFEAYNNLYNGKTIKYNEKEKYINYIKLIKSQDKDDGKRFWKEYLNGIQEKTYLPECSQNMQGYKSGKYRYDIGENLTQNIRNFVNEQGITMASFFYAMWGILLQKYNKTKDIVFGITLSGRNPKLLGIESMVGLFINTIPLRITFNENDTILDFIRNIREDCNKIMEYDYMPIVDIKAATEIKSKENLFDSIMVVESYPLDKELKNRTGTLSIDKYDMEEMSNYDLTFVVEVFDNVAFNFNYNSKIVNTESLNRVMNYLCSLCISMIRNPYARVKDLKLLTKEDEQKLYSGIKPTDLSYDKNKTINQLFEEQAKKNPNKIAIEFNSETITYSELNSRANKLAHILQKKGVTTEKVVALMVRRSIDMFVSIIAILKAGGVYLPIDMEYPKERKNFLLKDSNACLVLTQQEYMEEIEFEKEILNLDTIDYTAENAENLICTNKGSNAAYIIYTSGSTGKPKGTIVEHCNVHNLAISMDNKMNLQQYQSILCVTTIAFDMSIMETLVPIIIGLKIVLADEKQQKDPTLLAKLIIEKKVEIFETTPSRIRMMMIAEDEKINMCFKDIKLFLIGGEKMDEQIASSIINFSHGQLYNMYGPTETTVWSTIAKIDKGKKINIGTPIDNTYVYILDEDGGIVPPGIVGEICIGGDGVARGYLGDYELTKKKFYDNPFLENERIYRTGDLGRITSDNTIEYIGRKDYQTKIRGFRVELNEIESRLCEIDKIDAGAVISKKNKVGIEVLYAYFEAREKIDIKNLKEELSRKLPDYMVPSYFIQLSKIPLTQNLKVDRKKLQEFEEIGETEKVYEEPKNNFEKDVLEIWKKILEFEQIGVEDDFYELGGNSILLIKLYSLLNKNFSVDVSVQDLFDNRTIRKQAKIIELKTLSKENIDEKYQDDVRKIKLGRR